MALRRPLLFCATCGVTPAPAGSPPRTRVRHTPCRRPACLGEIRAASRRTAVAALYLARPCPWRASVGSRPIDHFDSPSARDPCTPASLHSLDRSRRGQTVHVRHAHVQSHGLFCQACFWVSRTLVRRVRALLASEVDRRVARIVRRYIRRWVVLRPEALQAGGSLDQRAVDGEVLVREPSPCVSLPATSSKNCRATDCRNSRLRFLLNVE